MKRLDEIKRDKQEVEELLQKVADYGAFMEPAEEELSEEDLELVSAARKIPTYEEFLKRVKDK